MTHRVVRKRKYGKCSAKTSRWQQSTPCGQRLQTNPGGFTGTDVDSKRQCGLKAGLSFVNKMLAIFIRCHCMAVSHWLRAQHCL